ncbi:tetratricopeptide repeat family protein [Lyngbya aestuarii BL J]|uniref:Tetratricopeptide repeat family protein n=1 Tax=Lyngbya aestuarii BL J TaxID=1348334 RepID=U7QA84_9CYAN|nr:transglutaminase-like domain-containing protein [Lyngbya aestuarii]ERT04754.1 tetratricopeptide repeat family protein [Lyngbya aestuarii BL J]
MNFSQARQRFYQEINHSNQQIDLAKAALYIAQEQFPELEAEDYLNALDEMAAEVLERLDEERYPLRVIQTLNQYLFEDLEFRGNDSNYYDPNNSYLNQVIDRRTGIPITLSVVYLEIAKRINFPMVGIGMPGHFLIRPEFEGVGIYVDVFNRGEVLFPEDCEAKLAEVYGQRVKLRPQFLSPVTSRQILARMLTNLKVIYMNAGEILKAVSAIERILLLFPEAPNERRDRGILYYQLERWTEARQDLENYLKNQPQAQDAVIIRQLLARMNSNR